MKLINAMVTSPEELDMRVHLRNECHVAGFPAMISMLRLVDNEELNIQLNVFRVSLLSLFFLFRELF